MVRIAPKVVVGLGTPQPGADTLHYELLDSKTKEEHQVRDVIEVSY